MNLLLNSPIYLVAFVSLIFILFFLYKTSELINKKKLLFTILILIVCFIITNIIFYPNTLPPKQQFRIAFLPLIENNNAKQVEHKWLKTIIPEMVAQKLSRTVGNKAVVAPLSWTNKIIDKDSLTNNNYIDKLPVRTKFPVYFTGSIKQNKLTYNLSYQLRDKKNILLNKTVSFKIEELNASTTKIGQEILSLFKFPADKLNSPEFSNSIQALQNYTDSYNSFLDENYVLALENARQAISADSRFTDAYILASNCLFLQGVKKRAGNHSSATIFFNDSKKILDKAMKLDSTNDEIYRLMGEYYIYNERWAQAELMLNKSFKINRNNYKIYRPLSRLHHDRFHKLGFESEEELFKRSIYINPCYESGYLLLSDHLLFNNKRDEAIELLNNFLKIDPNSVPVLMALGKIYIVRNDMGSIMDIFTKVIDLDPTNSDAYYNLGILYYNSEDLENAKKIFQKAVKINNHLNSQLYLAYISEVEGDIDTAIEYLRRRIHYKTGPDDEFAEEARKHLYKLIHSDSTRMPK